MTEIAKIVRRGEALLLGIAVEGAVLDVLTTQDLLEQCIQLLRRPHKGLVSSKFGTFGPFELTMNLHYDDNVSIFVDGEPTVEGESQSAGIYVEKDDLIKLLVRVLDGVDSIP